MTGDADDGTDFKPREAEFAMSLLMQARAKGGDPDAIRARELAGRLLSAAQTIDEGVASPGVQTDEERASWTAHVEARRNFVRNLTSTSKRIRRDEWAAFLELHDAISITIVAFTKRPESGWEPFVARFAPRLLEWVRSVYPSELAKIEPEDVIAALHASRRPRKGSPKWLAFVPIARKVVPGEPDANEIGREVSRLRARRG